MKGRAATTSSSGPRPRGGPERREGGQRRRSLLVLGCSLLAVLLLAPAAAGRPGPDARQPTVPGQSTALAVTASGAPQHVRGTDGREHIDYDLLITNAFTADVTLRSVEVLNGRGKRLLRLEGEALAAVTFELLPPGPPTVTVPKSGVVATMVDVAVPRRAVPTRLTHRITYELPPDAPLLALVASRRVHGPQLRVARRGPIVIPPPLKGPGWMAVNACCDSPSPHRDLLFPANGRFVTQEMFDIDWLRLRNGRLYEGDGSQTTQWHAEGAPLLAVGDGRVVRAVDGRPEIAPAPFGTAIIRTTDEFAGNYVVVRIRRGVYAAYAHIRPGTVRVRVGQRVRTGQRLGELGNTGNTSAPHLHFGIHDGPDLLTSNSLPYEFDRFRFAGVGELQEGSPGQAQLAPEVPVTGSPRRMQRAYPLSNAVVNFR
jgi:peptidase M23-like protein